MKIFYFIGMFSVLQLAAVKLTAQVDSVYWDFGTTTSATKYATFSSNANVLASACVADTGNSGGIFSATPYNPLYLTDQFTSTSWMPYPGASGEPVIRTVSKTGAFNAVTSSYISFSVTPVSGYSVTIKAISFGALRNAVTGPSTYTVRTSADGYATNAGTGTLISASYGGAKKTHTGLNIVGAVNTPIILRVYASSAITPNTGGNLFIDDIVIYYTLTPAGCTGTPAHAIATATPSGFCGSGSSNLAASGASSGTGISYQWYQSTTGLPGSFTSIGTATSITYTTPTLNATTYYYLVTTCSNSSLSDTSNIDTVTVTAPVTPSVSISSNAPSNTSCTGATVTFTATPANGGTTPSYQWKKNGGNVGTNSPSYTNNALITGDMISCVMTSNANCASPATATSNAITMTVNAPFTPSVSISSTPASPVCAGTSVTFTAIGVNSLSNITLTGAILTCTQATTATTSCVNGFFASGWTGAGAHYWQYQVSTLGYQNIVFSTPTSSSGTGPTTGTLLYSTDGVNFNTVTSYSTSTSCGSTGNILLPAAADNKPALYVRLIMTGAGASGGTNRVSSANTFKGNLLPAATPSYQWKKNGGNVGTNSTTYTDNSLANGDVITCVMTSNAACASVPTATSNSITMTVNPLVTPSVTISSNAPANTVCAGNSVTFTAAPVNGGSTPSYQWKKNGGNVGTNSATYTSSTLVNSDIISCVLTSNAACASPTTATSNNITMTVNPLVTPSVTISSNAPANTICAGVPVTFTATPVNGGATPSYQWKKNGGNVGTNSVTYTDNTLANSDVVTCVLTSNANCASPAAATSNAITMTVNPLLTPAVTISSNATANTICASGSVTFTAVPVNEGTTPVYQWKKNGGNVGTNSATYTDNTLVNSDIISCVLTSNANCASPATVTSNTITMTVNPLVTPAVTITSNAPANTVCAGNSVTFTAVPVNGGTTPSYQWKKNGSNAGTNSASYTDNALTNGDIISCELTSNAACASPATATSNNITMTVNPIVVPSVVVSSNAPSNTICAGTSVTFTAAPVNGGTTPSYQWKKNGNNVGTDNTTYTDNGLANNDVVTCVLTSNANCASPVTATSNAITMTVNTLVLPTVTIGSNATANTICAGGSATFTAIPTDGGTSPIYQWQKNSVNIGTNSATYTDNVLVNGDIISCVMTSNANCASPATVTSNNVTMTVNPIVTPSVSISSNAPANTLCAGTAVIFTATPVNEGSIPIYQWKKNGGNAGTNSASYTDNGLSNGDVITCELTSNATCASPAVVTSNGLNMTVNPIVVPGVTITPQSATICQGAAVNFIANPVNGGALPTYQWKVNGNNVGTGAAYGNSGTLNNNDVVSVVMTGNATCTSPATATASVTMTILPIVTPSVSISANPGTNICAGTSTSFTAVPVSGGSAPTYTWMKNGVNAGTGVNYNAGTGLANGDIISVILKSNAACPMGGIDSAIASATMTVNPVLNPSVAISSSAGASACAGSSVTFTATPTNAGGTPTYQWMLNSAVVGNNSSTYTSATLPTGNNIITCTVTTSYACYSTLTGVNTYNITVNPVVTPTITISSVDAPNGAVCSGSNVTFNATTTNAGSAPSYQWKKNGVNVGTNSASYNAGTSLATGDIVTCILYSSAPCTTPSSAAGSNQVIITVYPTLPASVSIISVIPANQACTGYPDTFKATVVNGGPAPVYQWKKDGNNVGTNSPMYVDFALAGGVITCQVTSSIPCAIPTPAISNPITLVANPVIPVMIKIYASPDSIGCSGQGIDFFSYFSNGGQTPQYKWYVNGKFIPGAVQPWFQSKTLKDGDVVTCEFFSSMTCAFSLFSNPVTMHLTPSPVTTVTISGTHVGNGITFQAATTNGGSSPKYQWRKNTVDIPGATNASFTLAPFQSTDKISLFFESSEECANPKFLLSNTLDVGVVTSVGQTHGLVSNLQLLPNPNNGKFSLKGSLPKGGDRDATLEVLNNIGQVVCKYYMKITGTEIDIPVDVSSRAVPGVYMMRFRIDDETETIRFVLQ